MNFKRNQVEEAISQTMGELQSMPSADLRIRIKRLLDLDRRGVSGGSEKTAQSFAFYSSRSPGSGSEVQFSNYEAFALLEALKLMRHEWPQGFIVSMMKQVRSEMEKRHTKILSLDRNKLFDKELVRKRNRENNVDGQTSQVEFLLIVSDGNIRKRSLNGPYPMFFDNERDAFSFQLKEPGRSCTWLELILAAWSLKENLGRTLPRKRGRGA